jgi:two-component sensor histidine kinase
MALIHEQLYQTKDLSNIDFGSYIRSLANSLLSSFGQRSNEIRMNIEAENVFLGIDYAIPCGLIINELVSNSLKYAFPSGEEGTISITTRFVHKDTFEVVVEDNGVGIPENLDINNTGTFGLQLLTDLVEHQLSGEIVIGRKAGTHFRIRFNL